MEVVDEEDEDDGDDEGGGPLEESEEVEDWSGILRGLLGDSPVSSCGLEHGERLLPTNDCDQRP